MFELWTNLFTKLTSSVCDEFHQQIKKWWIWVTHCLRQGWPLGFGCHFQRQVSPVCEWSWRVGCPLSGGWAAVRAPTWVACLCSRSRRPSAEAGCWASLRWSCRKAVWTPAGWSRGPGPGRTWPRGRSSSGGWWPPGSMSCLLPACWRCASGSPWASPRTDPECSRSPTWPTLKAKRD